MVDPVGMAGCGAIPVAFGNGGAVMSGGGTMLVGGVRAGNWTGPWPAATPATAAEAAADINSLAAFMSGPREPLAGGDGGPWPGERGNSAGLRTGVTLPGMPTRR